MIGSFIVIGELLLKGIFNRALNLSQFTGYDDILAENVDDGLLSQFVTWIKGFKQYAVRIL